jgi:hypothetical protein
MKVPTACLLRMEHPFGLSSEGALIMVVATENTCGLIVLTLSKEKGKVHRGPWHGSDSYLLTCGCKVQV